MNCYHDLHVVCCFVHLSHSDSGERICAYISSVKDKQFVTKRLQLSVSLCLVFPPEHVCSIIASMLRNLKSQQRSRLLNKFTENDCEKVCGCCFSFRLPLPVVVFFFSRLQLAASESNCGDSFAFVCLHCCQLSVKSDHCTPNNPSDDEKLVYKGPILCKIGLTNVF